MLLCNSAALAAERRLAQASTDLARNISIGARNLGKEFVMVERMGQNILAISRSRVASALITYGLCVVFFWLIVLCFSGQAQAATMSCKVQGHWRDVAYNEMPMKQYASLKNCIAWTAYQFNLPEELLYSIIYVERGPLNGKCGTNRNGTQDCGPGQINDVRLSELKQFGLSKRDIRKKPCHNIWAMGYLIRREIEKAGGNIWTGVGNYHYHYSVNQKVHASYINRIRDAWQNLVTSTYNYCIEDSGRKSE